MKPLSFVSLICFFVAASMANHIDLGPPTSDQAKSAMAKFEEAKEKAARPAFDAEAVASSQYLSDLQHVLDTALAAADLSGSNWTKAEMNRVQTGGPPSSEKPKVDIALPAWYRYTRAVEKARAGVRRSLENARDQYLIDLKAARKAALAKLKNLEEANRIDVEITRAQSLDFSKPPARTVNLLAIVDPAKDAIAGEWKLENNQLCPLLPRSPRFTIQFPYIPPEEYDYVITFKYVRGADSVRQLCDFGTHQFGWITATVANTVCILSLIDGQNSAPGNPTFTKQDPLKDGRVYKSTVKVRKASVEGYLDDKLLVVWKTDGHDLSLESYGDEKPHRHDTLGYGSLFVACPVISAEVIEVSGHGTVLTSLDAAPHRLTQSTD